MCGIFGWALSEDAIALFGEQGLRDLANVLSETNDARGGDSWGYYGYSARQDDYTTNRGLGKITPIVDELLEYSVVMAHCRNATTGEVTVENSHPFKVGNLLGAHNGCVYNHRELNNKYSRDFSVDSQHIFQHISEGTSIEDIIGYGSLEWVDLSDRKDLIYLFKQRQSLSVLRVKEDNSDKILGTVWSSLIMPVTAFLGKIHIHNSIVTFSDEVVHYATPEDFYIWEEKKMSFGEDLSVRNRYRAENYKSTYVNNSSIYNKGYLGNTSNNNIVTPVNKGKRSRYLELLISAARTAVITGCRSEQNVGGKELWVPKEDEVSHRDADDEKTVLWSRKEVLSKQIKTLESRLDKIFRLGYDKDTGALLPKQQLRLTLATKALARKKDCLKSVEEKLMEKEREEGIIDVSAVW